MKTNEFICAICKKTYEKGQSDAEARKESLDIFGEIPKEEMAVICDDCFNRKSLSEIREMGDEYKSKHQ